LDKTELYKLQKSAAERMDRGEYEEVLSTARKIQNLGPDYLVSYISSGILIDLGSILKRKDLILEGKNVLKRDLKELSTKEELGPSAYYNLANAHLALFNISRDKRERYPFFAKSDLVFAKRNLRKALTFEIKDESLQAQILINLGNCFDSLGRVVDSLECYNEALELQKDLGMALGNKGLTLLFYAQLSGEHFATIMTEAYFLLKQALDNQITPEAFKAFSDEVENIESDYFRRVPKEKPKFPGYKIKSTSEFQNFLVKYCLENKLYLNFCNYCQQCNAAIGDSVVIKEMLVRKNDDSYLTLSEYLNQMKQDYVASRFLLILSRYQKMKLDFVDKDVRLIDTRDYGTYNIYIQLVKIAFKGFYDVLDKIAFFINDYIKLGIPDKKISFHKIWYLKKKVIREEIINTKNFSLNALFDIHRDFENGEYSHLRNSRNALTHRFLSTRIMVKTETDEIMTEEALVSRTLELAKIVRNCVIYLLHFVQVEELKKKKENKGISFPLFAYEISDERKTTRHNTPKKDN